MRRIARTAEPRCRKTGTDTVGTPLAMPALRAFDHGNRKHPAPQLRGTTRPLRSLSRSHRYPVSVSGGIERLPGGNRRLEARIRLAGRGGTDLYLDLIALIFTWILLAASAIDFRHQLLPDDLILPLLWLGLLAALFGLYTDLPSAVIGAMAGYLSLWSVYQVFRLLTGKKFFVY